MGNRSASDWMWSEAIQMLARADRLHREAFRFQQILDGMLNHLIILLNQQV